MGEGDFSSSNQLTTSEVDADSPITETLTTKYKERDNEIIELALKAKFFGGTGIDGPITISANTTLDALLDSFSITDGVIRCTTFTLNAGITLSVGRIQLAGDITSASLVVDGISDTSDLSVDQRMSVSADVVDGNYIDIINSGVQITMKNSTATATGTRTFTFFKQQQLIILASSNILINGTIACDGAGHQGALRGFGDDTNGLNGTAGDFGGGSGAGESSGSTGGAGATGFEYNSGGGAGAVSGGNGGSVDSFAGFLVNSDIADSIGGASGGAGGNSGTDSSVNYGGNGGGFVFFESPVINITSTGIVTAVGLIGGSGSAPGGSDGSAGGGGGGVIILRAGNLIELGSVTAAGGAGQPGGGGSGGAGTIIREVVAR